MKGFLPLILDLTGKKVVIFGGGEVSERKALLFSGNAMVTVVSRDFTPHLMQLSGENKIKLIKVEDLNKIEIPEYLKNAFMTIPATNDTLLNDRIAGLANERSILVNRVDDLGDIIVPSVIKTGDIVIGISTLGQSPALSRFIRKRIEEVITPEFEQMSRLQKEIREKLKSEVDEQKDRREILRNIINDNDVWVALSESYEKAYKLAEKNIHNR